MSSEREKCGGTWYLDIRGRQPESVIFDRPRGARAEAERVIVSGPDTPGRRFLLARKPWLSLTQSVAAALPRVPEIPREPVVASRAALERLQTGRTGPTRFDPEHDPELQTIPGREPGEGD